MNNTSSTYDTMLFPGEYVTADCVFIPKDGGQEQAVTNMMIGGRVESHSLNNYYRKTRQATLGTDIILTTFASGATREAKTGKGRFDLIPFEAMRALAKRYELGAAQHGDRNWERGMPLQAFLSAMRRHAHQIGYDYTEDHAGAVLWNAAGFVTTVDRIRAGTLPRELDDIGYFINEGASK